MNTDSTSAFPLYNITFFKHRTNTQSGQAAVINAIVNTEI